MAAHPTSEPVVNLPTNTQVAEPLGIVTLLVRHLPEGIPHDIVSRLFAQYGASAVRPCSGGRLRNAAFVDFKNEAFASQAHRQLNGLRFLGKVLQVQRANKPNENKKPEESGKDGQPFAFSTVTSDSDSKSGQGLAGGEPIAPKLGINYPFPPHLQYAYPPPDANILANITNALIAVPPLYTQVLHLMNKMNLPPPFRLALPTPPLPKAAQQQPTEVDHQSSSESEMESDEDTGASKSGRKRARHETLVGPGMDKDVTHETVGVKPSSLTPKEIPRIRKNKHVMQIKITQKVSQEEHKEDIELEGPAEEPREEDSNLKPFASLEELEKGRLPPQDILSLPMFKNYTAGNPSPVLYIKNLAKDVITDDFYYIFGSQFGSIEAAKSSLGVRLMQEGRMRGQAFLTFPSVEVAHRALNLVNGFVFKGKPMIIQFGRNPGSAKPSE
ncbi:hypothetical protein N665_0088s0126 [Sinapis alba]|nr:hypothetical protein N665_0088s0126 [Sinapis alba]